jgi:hypothetical protein
MEEELEAIKKLLSVNENALKELQVSSLFGGFTSFRRKSFGRHNDHLVDRNWLGSWQIFDQIVD